MEEKVEILLMEDNLEDVRLLESYLKRSFQYPFALSVATHLKKGMQLLKEKKFDIIILDLSLPDSEGLQTFKSIHEHSPAVPVIVLTGDEKEETGLSAVKMGAQDFLVKSDTDGKELSRAINYSIERFRLLKNISENAKKLEEHSLELQKERQKLANAQKLAHIGNWEWNLADDKVVWSDELYRIHELDPQKVPINTTLVRNLVHAGDVSRIKKIMAEAKRNHSSFTFYYRVVLWNGNIKTLQVRGESFTEDGYPKMKGTVQDVTDRMREEELEKLVLAATQSYNSVIITDKNGKIEWVNEGFTKLSGYKLNEVLNTHGELLRQGNGKESSTENDFYETLRKEKKPVTYESRNFSKDGKEYWVITTLTPILGKNNEVERIIAIDSDITLRKRIEEELVHANKVAEHSLRKGNKALFELMKAKKELEESMKIKEQFLANMSHEIRTPMNVIIGFTDLMLKTELKKEQKQYIDAVKTSGENLLVIINDILDFSKMQSGQFAFERINMNIPELIQTVAGLMKQRAREKNIELLTRMDEKIPESLTGDPTRLTQILLNLLSNAIKFTEKGNITIGVKMLSEKESEMELQFSVKDTGIGISEDKLASIFQGFTQASNETTRKYGGTGLGLTIVKQLVELQGGTIEVKSELQKGSEFLFNLRFKKNKKAEEENNTAPVEIAEEEPDHPLDILLVEDNQLNQMLAKKVLTDKHWNVEIAENGLIALEKIGQHDFDLVLMDIQLPEMDGYEATRSIRKNFPSPKKDIPIIAMTAHAMAGEASKCISMGMDDYISKPFNANQLYSKILEAIRKKPQQNDETH